MNSLKYKNVTIIFINRIPRKKKKRYKKAMYTISNQVHWDMTFFIPNIKLMYY